MANFRATLIQLSQDHLIDRADWQTLKAAGAEANKHKGSADASLARQVLAFLDSTSGVTRIRYGIPGQKLEFDFTPAYAEGDPIPGATPLEKVGNISQRDNLPETVSDGSRCGAASLLNAWLLLGGSLGEANRKLGLSGDELTYANLHKAQEALFVTVNTDGNDSLSSSFGYTYRGDTLISTELRGEIKQGIDKLGLKGDLLTGSAVSSLSQRQQAVDSFWKSHPEGVLLTGVYLDTATGALRSPSAAEPQNHFTVIFQQQGQLYYLADTGASDNGANNSLHKLSQDQLAGFVYQSSGHVIGLTR